ncbi:cytochrome C [Christiangramia fulva]|uniref:Cytochrome C n=2 Tax=Christiangramia fulva TaxID=2126553 RepID=A0A2R3ZB36_9FLAO|nr:cytochrome C [Christiangramia fulva]
MDKAMAEEKSAAPRDNAAQEEGKAIFTQYCVTCHQANGSGVPNLNPPLKQTEYVLGEKDRLIGILLNGSSEGLEIKGKTYSNNMPSFDYLSDQQIADVLTYVRSNFGNDASAVSAAEVKTARKKNKN